MEVHFEAKRAIVRYEAEKVRLEKLLRSYAGTQFTVSAAGPPTAVLRRAGLIVKGWVNPAGSLVVELANAEGSAMAGQPSVSLAGEPVPGMKLLEGPAQAGARRPGIRFAFEGVPATALAVLPVEFRCSIQDRDGRTREERGTLRVPVPGGGSVPAGRKAGSPGLPLVGGTLELELAHLCGERGCVEHLRGSLEALGDLAGLRARPDADGPRAALLVRAGLPVDLAGLRQGLRERGVEVRRLRARDLGPFRLQLELRRLPEAGREPQACSICTSLAIESVLALPWTSAIEAGEAGFTVSLRDGEQDLAALLDALERSGIAPAALWLVPEGVTLPPAAPPADPGPAEPRAGGSEAHPVLRVALGHECAAARGLLELVGNAEWASRSGASGGTGAFAAIGDRKQADLMPLLRDLRSIGVRPSSIGLSGFGDLRIQCEFAHLCGEIEYSKPPEKPPKKETSEEPFVPAPLRPASTSKARQAIEKALNGVRWIAEATYRDYHTRPEFNGPRKLILSLTPADEGAVRGEELVRALSDAGFPPTSVVVSRLFPGLPFGAALPADLALTAPDGEKRPLSALRRPGRPLALCFLSLRCPKWDKYKYEADPRFFRTLKEATGSWKEKVDFAAVSSNPDDSFPELAAFIDKAGLEVPLFHDPDGRVRALLNAQVTPAPHLYLFDGEGRLRYAGEAHTGWEKPEEKQEDFLGRALKQVLEGKLEANGAAFFNSSKCNCSSPGCKCPKCGCGPSCRCAIGHCKVGLQCGGRTTAD